MAIVGSMIGGSGSGPGQERMRLAIVFAVAGVPKLKPSGLLRKLWATYKLPEWTIPAVGVVEVGTAVALARPQTARVGAYAAIVIMAGALLTNLRDKRNWISIPVNLGIAYRALGVARGPDEPA
jgi:uncharacterized membrane protein YphA (DoxX/SURF4 family)